MIFNLHHIRGCDIRSSVRVLNDQTGKRRIRFPGPCYSFIICLKGNTFPFTHRNIRHWIQGRRTKADPVDVGQTPGAGTETIINKGISSKNISHDVTRVGNDIIIQSSRKGLRDRVPINKKTMVLIIFHIRDIHRADQVSGHRMINLAHRNDGHMIVGRVSKVRILVIIHFNGDRWRNALVSDATAATT